MPALTIYRLRQRIGGETLTEASQFVDLEGKSVSEYGPVSGPGFEATLYMTAVPPHPPRWASFLREGFGDEVSVPQISSAGALMVVAVKHGKKHDFFAMPFGTSGRFLMRPGVQETAYGVRVALNLIYPSDMSDDAGEARLIGVDAKRHGLDTVRSRLQTSRASTPETFDLDRLRDVLNAATGHPLDHDRWGSRISGGDGLSMSNTLPFEEIGSLCTHLANAHERSDYRTRFAWLDQIQPVADPDHIDELNDHVLELLRQGKHVEFDLAPPEIVSWSEIDDFRYSSDKRGVTHRELRLEDLLKTLDTETSDLSIQRMHSVRVRAINGEGTPVHDWRAWHCLTGSFEFAGRTYVLDEGGYFVVANDFLDEVDQFVDGIPAGPTLPDFELGQDETAYNNMLAASIAGSLLMHEKFIPTAQTGSRVELCDLLTPTLDLIHVKRELGSRDLNHLFAQGFTSAESLQVVDFRKEVRTKLVELAPGSGLDKHFPEASISTSDFNVCYAVVAAWKDRPLSKALPFFAKVNFRRTARDLINRGFRVSWVKIAGPSATWKKKAQPDK